MLKKRYSIWNESIILLQQLLFLSWFILNLLHVQLCFILCLHWQLHINIANLKKPQCWMFALFPTVETVQQGCEPGSGQLSYPIHRQTDSKLDPIRKLDSNDIYAALSAVWEAFKNPPRKHYRSTGESDVISGIEKIERVIILYDFRQCIKFNLPPAAFKSNFHQI